MLLTVDIGNTNVTLGAYNGNILSFTARLATETRKTSDQYAIEIKNVLSLYLQDYREIEDCIISSVVPQLVNIIREAVEKLIDITPMVVGPGVKTGLNIHMDEPRRVGSDLIVDAVAAIKEYDAPVMIIDMGTATTISIVDDKGSYAGGVILPGIRVSVDALASRTAQLPRISLEAPGHVIGKNTLDCMKSGVVYGNASCIDGMIDRMADEIGINMHTVNKAYNVLRQEGYVKVDRRKGAVIAVDNDRISALEEVRKELQVILAKVRCKNISKEEIHELIEEIYDGYQWNP